MWDKISYRLHSGKRVNAYYFACQLLQSVVPNVWWRRRLNGILRDAQRRNDYEYMLQRVNYYNKLTSPKQISGSTAIAQMRRSDYHSIYYYDTMKYARYFDAHRKIVMLDGDITHIPSCPTLLKSRPVEGDNENSVLLPLNEIRNFSYVIDPMPWDKKKSLAVFRGDIIDKQKRIDLFERHFGNPLCDLGVSNRYPLNEQWVKGFMSIREQLNYRYLIAIEGNDVASNLPWVMSSNTIAVMPPPQYETWFEQGCLIPDVHYLAIKSDYSDLSDRIEYCQSHLDFAQNIIENAHRWVAQFLDSEREQAIALMVVQKYHDNTFE